MGTGENLIEDIEFTFIELPKFNKKPTELTSTIDRWVYFIKNAGDINVIPEDTTDEGLKSAYMGAEQYNWTKEELEAYDKIFMREQDDRGKTTFAYKQGKEEMAKELKRKEEENAEKNLNIVKFFLNLGVSIGDVVKATGLTVEEVKKLKDKK